MNVTMLMQFKMQYHSDKSLFSNLFSTKETTRKTLAYVT